MFVAINLNPVVIYRLNIVHRNSFIRFAFSAWRNYNVSKLHVGKYNLNFMCPELITSTHIILQVFD